MKKPSPFFVEYLVGDRWGNAQGRIVDCLSFPQARALWDKLGGRVMQRENFRDTASEEERVYGPIWEWDEREILS